MREGGVVIADGGYDRCPEKKLPFGVRHPVLRGLSTIIFGFFVMLLIDLTFYAIGGMKMMEGFGIISVAVGVIFFLKGYVQMIYPPRY